MNGTGNFRQDGLRDCEPCAEVFHVCPILLHLGRDVDVDLLHVEGDRFLLVATPRLPRAVIVLLDGRVPTEFKFTFITPRSGPRR
jgi:hypothetical protein